MKTGIYKIINTVNGKFYIGSSEKIADRWDNHKSELRRDIHPNRHLLRAWKKYGESSFLFQVIEECLEKDLIEREQWYLDNHLKAQEFIQGINNFFLKKGYNILPIVGRGFDGAKHSLKSMDKMGVTTGARAILAVSEKGKILHEFSRAFYAKKEYGISDCTLYLSIKKRQLTKKSVGFIFKEDYVKGYTPKPLLSTGPKKGSKYKGGKMREVNVYTIYGQPYMTFENMHDCAKFFNLSSGNVHRKMKTALNKYLMTADCAKYIFRDSHTILSDHRKYWDNIFNTIRESNTGRLSVTDCFGKHIGKCEPSLLAKLLNVTENNMMYYKGYVKSLKLELV